MCRFGFKKYSVTIIVIIAIVGLCVSTIVVLLEWPTDDIVSSLNCQGCMEKADSMEPCTCMDCKVFCQHLARNVLEDEIINVVDKNCSRISLTLNSCEFPDQTIQKGWLKKLDVPVVELELYYVPVQRIEESAFAEPPFHKLDSLIIIDSEIDSLERRSFSGLNKLRSFSFQFTTYKSTRRMRIEAKLLEPMQSLVSLQLHKTLNHPRHVINLTGIRGSFPSQLRTVDFRFNALAKLPPYAFVGARSLRQIYLGYNRLERIQRRAFWGAPLQLIDISNNQLQTLTEGSFDKMDTNSEIIAKENPWRCDCDLQWFIEFSLSENGFVSEAENITCSNHLTFPEVQLSCTSKTGFPTYPTTEIITTSTKVTKHTELPAMTSTTTSANLLEVTTDASSTELPIMTTSELSEITLTTTPSTEYTKLYCIDLRKSPTHLPYDVHRTFMKNVVVRVQGFKYLIDLHDIDHDSMRIALFITGELNNIMILWFNSIDIAETGCLTQLTSRTIVLNQLRRGETYTVCLMHTNSTTVSPYSCFGLTVWLDWNQRTWIANKDMLVVLLATSSIMLVIIVLTIAIVFCCVKRYPELMKGNKRVIVVEKEYEQSENYISWLQVQKSAKAREIAKARNTETPPPLPPCNKSQVQSDSMYSITIVEH